MHGPAGWAGKPWRFRLEHQGLPSRCSPPSGLCTARPCSHGQAPLRPVGVVSCWTRFVSSGPRLQAEVPAATCSCNTFMHHHGQSRTLCTRAAWPCVRVTAAPTSRLVRLVRLVRSPPSFCSCTPSPVLFNPPSPTFCSFWNSILTFPRKPANLLSLTEFDKFQFA